MIRLLSNKDELLKLESILAGYLKLPFTEDTIPGSLMESVLATVRNGRVLNTYDFIGVSLDIENYCTLRLFFNQTQLLYRRPECDKPGKYCSLSRLPFRGC